MGCDGLWSYLTNFVMRLKATVVPRYCGTYGSIPQYCGTYGTYWYGTYGTYGT